MASNQNGYCSDCGRQLSGSEIEDQLCLICGPFQDYEEGGEAPDIDIGDSTNPGNKNYTIKLDFNGGTFTGDAWGVNCVNVPSINLSYTDIEFEPPTDISALYSIVPHKTGVVFAGWSATSTGTTILPTEEYLNNYSVLYAVYTTEARVVYLEADYWSGYNDELGFSYNINTDEVYVKDTLGNYHIILDSVFCVHNGELQIPEGWSYKGDFYLPGESILISSHTYLYPVWEKPNESGNLTIKINNEYKKGTPFVKVDGVYKKGIKIFTKVDGVWKTK